MYIIVSKTKIPRLFKTIFHLNLILFSLAQKIKCIHENEQSSKHLITS